MNLKKSASAVSFWSILSKFFGYARESVIAYFFGASASVDAFLVATLIPNTVAGLLASGLPAAMTSIYKELAVNDEKESRHFIALLAGLILSAGILMSALLLFGSPVIIRFLAPGFSVETHALANRLAIFFLPTLIMMLTCRFASTLLYANDIFQLPVLMTSLLPNLILIATILLTAGRIGILSLVIGTLLSWLIPMVFLIRFLYRMGFGVSWQKFWQNSHIRHFLQMIVPVLLASGVGQIYLFIDRMLASGLQEGSIAALNYAWKVSTLPENIFAFGLGVVILPAMSTLAAHGSYDEMGTMARKGLGTMIFIAVPSAVGLLALAEPITRLLFYRGAFDERALVMTSSALMAFAAGVAATCINPICTRTFFALQETRIPLLTSLVSLVVKVMVSLSLIGSLGHVALALGDSAAATGCTLILFLLLHRRLPDLFNRQVFWEWSRIFLAAGIMGTLVFLLNRELAAFFTGSGGALICLFISITMGAGIYGMISYFLHIRELDYFLDLIRRKERTA